MIFASTWNFIEFLVFWFAFGIVLRKVIIGSFSKKYLFLAILFSLSLQLILGTFQIFLRQPVLPQIFTPFGQPPFFESFTYVGSAIFPRMYGTTPHPNILAATATLFSAIILFLDSSRLRGILAYFIALAVILGTLSRTGMIAIACLTILFLGRKFFSNQLKHRKFFSNTRLLTIFLLGFFLISGVFISVLPHDTINLPYFIESRAKLEDAYVRFMVMFPNLWLFGTGFLGTLPLLYQNYTSLPFPMLLENSFFFDIPHHAGTLLHLELGLPVCALLFWVISRWFVDLQNHISIKKRDTYVFVLSLGLLFMIFGVFDHFLIY
jgi:hypothetical protein